MILARRLVAEDLIEHEAGWVGPALGIHHLQHVEAFEAGFVGEAGGGMRAHHAEQRRMAAGADLELHDQGDAGHAETSSRRAR